MRIHRFITHVVMGLALFGISLIDAPRTSAVPTQTIPKGYRGAVVTGIDLSFPESVYTPGQQSVATVTLNVGDPTLPNGSITISADGPSTVPQVSFPIDAGDQKTVAVTLPNINGSYTYKATFAADAQPTVVSDPVDIRVTQ